MKPIEVVSLLNDKLHGKNAEKEYNFNHYFGYELCGFVEAIYLFINIEYSSIKIKLWDDQNSQQIFIEDKNDYEPLQDTILREYNYCVNIMKILQKDLK